MTDNALKLSPSLYYFTTSISHVVEIISPDWGTGIFDAIFSLPLNLTLSMLKIYWDAMFLPSKCFF